MYYRVLKILFGNYESTNNKNQQSDLIALFIISIAE